MKRYYTEVTDRITGTRYVAYFMARDERHAKRRSAMKGCRVTLVELSPKNQ